VIVTCNPKVLFVPSSSMLFFPPNVAALLLLLLLLVSILFALLLVDELSINVPRLARKRSACLGTNRWRSPAGPSSSSFDVPRIYYYPTQYVTPDGRDSANRNITLTVKTLHKRYVYILEWSSALVDPLRPGVSVLVSTAETESSAAAAAASNGSKREPLLLRPSVLASRYGCRYAVNAGPFERDGKFVGSVVSNGRVRQYKPPSADYVGFGVTEPRANATSSWVVGSLSTVDELESLRDFVTGFGWLVYQGRDVVVEPDDEERTGAARAPRTAIGVTTHGSLVVVVADGCEKWCVSQQGTCPSSRRLGLCPTGVLVLALLAWALLADE
jgi:Phosphodiester glycosidase